MTPIEYECDPFVSIRRCPVFISVVGNKPPYWYIRQSIQPIGPIARRLRAARSDASWYWSECGWRHHTPIQYESAEQAYAAYIANNIAEIPNPNFK